MGLFISYSSQDRPLIEALTAALRRGRQQVWFDEELGGGEAWWSMILEQIRAADVFIVALSNHWLESKPCQAEFRYAQALNRPILPVRVGPVDSVRVNPVAALQIVEYENPTVDTSIQLISAVHALQAAPKPLPSPLPEEPPVPFAYLMRLSSTLTENELSPQQQTILLAELKSGLADDGGDPSARRDLAQLLSMLRNRHDVTYRIRSEIDELLASLEQQKSPSVAAAGARPAAAAPAAVPPPGPPAPASPQPTSANRVSSGAASAQRGAKTGGRPSHRLIVIGGAALAVIVAIVVVVMLVTQGAGKKSSAKPSGSTSSAGTPAHTDLTLLGADEIGSILGDPNMVTVGRVEQLRAAQGTLSQPECAGTFEALDESAYQGSGTTLVHGEILHTAGQDPPHRVVEGVATFGSSEKARAFVETSAAKWGTCAGQTVTFTGPNKSTEWAVGDVSGAAPKISQVRTLADGSNRTCQHALSAVSDMVIDVQACGLNVADAAVRIAEQVAARGTK
ncbi:Serine/threonine-protein kinase PknH [Mycobacterium basiliense]|uniref:Serine/threonine-protein kinase PknH n=1 Tax=Mycobacterium basiliense TaxID=2094119 RepID=A0A447GJH4_9MYCO|nr:sensor domain-containing protein [Mycobacterium basiliense]VDM90657.1 Serine/threonine-protein kinase PknH [Mycobacterium basiliense]